jgi:predicted amidohydrolase
VAAPFGRDLDRAFSRIGGTLGCARERGAGLVVFPESALGGYIREPLADEIGPGLPPALDPDGPEIERLIRLAGHTVVCVGYTERTPGGVYSSAVCVSGDGVLGHHRKVHLPPSERFAYTAGDRFAAFDTPAGRIGMLLCYDKLFPEAARTLALDGAETIACMASWPFDRHRPAADPEEDRQTRHFDLMAAARAVENQVAWVSSNQAGVWGPVRFLGRAQVVDADGTVRARTCARGGIAVARLDSRAHNSTLRSRIDHLADRRPSAYAASGAAPGALRAAPLG